MIQQRMMVTKSMQKLLSLFNEIEDEDIRDIIAEIVFLENKHRSSSRERFPMKELRDIIDSVARLQEGNKR